MPRPPNLNAYLYFETVARRGTITRAAEELSVSPSAVSQQIKQLEQLLGVRLFRREGRRLSLTLEGEQLFQSASGAIRSMRTAEASLRRTRQGHRFNLRVPPSFGVRWLGPRLHDFIARHPDQDLAIDAAPDPTDFDREVMDLEIRYGLGGSDFAQGYHGAVVLQDLVLPLCSPAYLDSLPGGADGMAEPDAIVAQALMIESSRALCTWDRWLGQVGLVGPMGRRGIKMDRSSMALQLALDGTGMALESLVLAAPLVAAGRLVPVLPNHPALRFDAYWALCPSRHLSRRAVSQFLTWLTGQAQTSTREAEGLLNTAGVQIEDIEMGSLPGPE